MVLAPRPLASADDSIGRVEGPALEEALPTVVRDKSKPESKSVDGTDLWAEAKDRFELRVERGLHPRDRRNALEGKCRRSPEAEQSVVRPSTMLS